MATVLANAPLSTTTSSKVDYDPDDEWKLRKRMEEDLESMVADAKEGQAIELRNSLVTLETPLGPDSSYKQAIEGLTTEQDQNKRHGTASVPYSIEEQQNITKSTKQSSNLTEPLPVVSPMPPSPSPRLMEEHEISFTSPQNNHDETLGSFRRGYSPSTSGAEDALPAKTYKLGGRGSAVSMKSTGSGVSIRPPITETIPERADERPDGSAIEENDHKRMIEQGMAWISTDKPREKEEWPHHGRNSRLSPVDALRPDDFPGSSGLESASSKRQYATSPVPNGPLLPAKPSSTLINDRSEGAGPSSPSSPISSFVPDLEVQSPWRDRTVDGNRHPDYDHPQQARLPPSTESFPFTQTWYHNSPNNDHPSFGGRETDPSHRGNRKVTNEYDSDQDPEYSDSSDDGAKKLRDLEARMQKLEESRREAGDELKRTEVEIQRLAAEEARKKREEEEKRKEGEVERREEEVRKQVEEVRRKEEEVERKEEAARKEEEAKRMGEEAKKKEEVRRKERDAKKKEEDAKEAAEQEEARRKAEELNRKEEKTRQRVTESKEGREGTKQIPLEVQKMVEDALTKQEDLKRMREAREKNKEMKEREDILRRREEELMRREADNFRREAEIKKKEEAMETEAMMEGARKREVESKLTAEQRRVLQRAEFRKMEEIIKLTLEEERKHDYSGNDNAWSDISHIPAFPGTSPSISWTPPEFNGAPISERSTSTSVWDIGPGTAIKPTATCFPPSNCSSANTSTWERSVGPGTYVSDADRTRAQRALRQQEQFRLTQEKLEAQRQLKSAGRPLPREELQRVFKNHERLWNRLNTLSELSWSDFPWPMAKPPLNPDDMSLSLIGAYIQSPVYPDKDKSKTIKDRIKEHIRRWHLARFETTFLPKVVEDEKKKVKHGVEKVGNYLRDLLMKEIDKQELEENRGEADGYESDEARDGEVAIKRIRDLEAKLQKLEKDKKEAENGLNTIKVELQRIDKAAREDEENRKEEERKVSTYDEIYSVYPSGQTTFVVYGVYSFITALYLLL